MCVNNVSLDLRRENPSLLWFAHYSRSSSFFPSTQRHHPTNQPTNQPTHDPIKHHTLFASFTICHVDCAYYYYYNDNITSPSSIFIRLAALSTDLTDLNKWTSLWERIFSYSPWLHKSLYKNQQTTIVRSALQHTKKQHVANTPSVKSSTATTTNPLPVRCSCVASLHCLQPTTTTSP